MGRTISIKSKLYQLAASWDKDAKFDSRDGYNYSSVLNEVLFHADLRFHEYIQFADEEGPFINRLDDWLSQVSLIGEKQSLLKLASLIDFIDRRQMNSLYRDAYRRIIVPFITTNFTSSDLISNMFESILRTELKKYRLYSITESFKSTEFINKNSLSGLPKFGILSEDPSQAVLRLPSESSNITGLIILEDFVGTGKQSGNVLKAIAKLHPSWKNVFIPLIILQKGYETLLADPELSEFLINPVLVIAHSRCLEKSATTDESEEIPYIRTVVKSTATRVLKRLNALDDPPDNEFGYRGSGSLLVTCHNTPNNTLPLIHHKSPNWKPLFRRVHHSKDGL